MIGLHGARLVLDFVRNSDEVALVALLDLKSKRVNFLLRFQIEVSPSDDLGRGSNAGKCLAGQVAFEKRVVLSRVALQKPPLMHLANSRI